MDHPNTHLNIIPALVLALAFLAASASPAFSYSVMQVGGYKVKVFAEPDPIVSQMVSLITFKVLLADDKSPVTGIQVEVGVRQLNNGNKLSRLSEHPAGDFTARGETDEFGNFGFETNFSTSGLYHLEATFLPHSADVSAQNVKLGFSVHVQPPNNGSSKLVVILMKF